LLHQGFLRLNLADFELESGQVEAMWDRLPPSADLPHLTLT
jgi:hypothetical protein